MKSTPFKSVSLCQSLITVCFSIFCRTYIISSSQLDPGKITTPNVIIELFQIKNSSLTNLLKKYEIFYNWYRLNSL